MKALVAYYSRTGNTRFVAQRIAVEIAADLEEIIDRKNRKGRMRFVSCGKAAKRGDTTEIEDAKISPSDYDLVVVGTPVWGGYPAPAVRTYLSKYDFSGKKIAVFCTCGRLKGRTIERVKAIVPGGTFVGELAVAVGFKKKEKIQNEISAWCKSLTVIT